MSTIPAICAATLAMLSTGASAHEIGTTRVAVVFQESRTYDIEVVTDAASLLEKLEFGGAPAELTAARLERMSDRFRRRIDIAFDQTHASPKIQFTVAPPKESGQAPVATIKMTGQIPQGASHFTWSYGWTFVTYAITIRGSGSSSSVTEWLEGSQPSKAFAMAMPPPRPNRLQTAWRYLTLGFTHILPNGLDHMLFVLGIYLLSRRTKHVLWQVSAFTIAHSITLGLSMYGLVTVTPKVVEPLIALSIAYVAVENIFLSELKAWRVALVFAFGLLHGMGFAGALKELGLPRTEFLTALLTFNLGVEAGQLAVIATAFLLLGWHCANRTWYRSRVVIPISAMIACTALVWTVQRLHA